MSQSMSLTDVLEKIHKDTEGDKLKVKDIVDALEGRGYGPLLLSAALFTILPTGGIPGVPTFTALLVIFIAGQILIGRDSPWVPEFINSREIKKEKFEKARKKAEPYTRKFDQLLSPRLEKLTSNTGLRIVSGICIVLALTMPFLEILPFVAMIPALAIGIMALGLTAKDGYVLIFGIITAITAMAVSIYMLMG